MKMSHCNKAGFTLMELIITLTVLVILISIGVASYSAIFSQQELLQRTEHLYHFLRLANSQAIKLNKKVYVHFCQLNSTGVWKMAMAEQANCDCFTADSCQVEGRRLIEELADGQTVILSPADMKFSGEQASYGPMRFSVNPGSVTLTDSNGTQLKVIQSSMRLRVCSPDKAQLGYPKC
jgi:type IV fimbrial biogenesis protein FimT